MAAYMMAMAQVSNLFTTSNVKVLPMIARSIVDFIISSSIFGIYEYSSLPGSKSDSVVLSL